VVQAHPTERSDRKQGSTGGVDQVLVELVGRRPEELDDQRREDRDQDQEDQERRARERNLVTLEAPPGDLTE